MDSSTGLYKIEPLSGADNYQTWKFRMEDILQAQELWPYVDGSAKAPDPAQDATASKEWVKKDRFALSQIRLRLKDTIYVYVRSATSAATAWETLKRTYEAKGALGIVLARRKLFRAKCEEGENIEEFLRKLQGYREDLGALGKAIEDDEFGITILTALPESWDTFTSALDTTALTDSPALIARILEQDRRQKMKADGDTVLFAKGKERSSPNKDKDRECFYCHKKGHMKKDCRKRIRDERDQNSTNMATESNGSNFTFMAITEKTLAAGTAAPSAWIGDNATSRHCTNDKGLLEDYEALKTEVEGVGSQTALGQGTIRLISMVQGEKIPITLKDVLFLPKIPHNLISLGRMEAAGTKTQIEDGRIRIKKTGKKGKIVMTGKRLPNHLYQMDVEPALRNTVNYSEEKTAKKTLQEWHRIFGHIRKESVEMLAKEGMVQGMEIKPDKDNSTDCRACTESKITRFSVPKESHTVYDNIGDMTYSDVWGPSKITGIRGERYFVSFTDAKTRRTAIYLMKNKNEAVTHLKHYRAMVKTQTGHRLKCLRIDNGKEYDNEAVRKYCNENGIKLEWTAPYSSSQNGVSERLNRTIVENARAMLAQNRTDLNLWPEAVMYACYLKNRSPTRALGNITPEEAWSGKKPNVARLHEFGSNMWVLTENPKLAPAKVAPKAKPYQFMGLSDESRAYRYYKDDTKHVLTTRNAIFQKGETPTEEEMDLPPYPELSEGENSGSAQPGQTTEAPKEAKKDAEEAPRERLTIRIPPMKTKPPTPVDPAPEVEPAVNRRSTRLQPNKESAAIIEEILLGIETQGEPLSTKEAREYPDWPKWKEAMDAEIDQLKDLGTFELTDLPANRKAVTSKWVYRYKTDPETGDRKHKSRLVARGFSQIPGIDVFETFSPVVRHDTLKTLIAIAAKRNMLIHQLDFIGAYLHGKLDEEIYMEQPEGYTDGTARVWRLHKALYGLRQSGRIWNKTLHEFMTNLGYTQLDSDKCVYIKRDEAGDIILAIHVDDILAIASNSDLMDKAKAELKSKYPLKDVGEAKELLGLEIDKDPGAKSIKISQSKYIKSIISRFGMDNSNPVSTPMDPNVKLRAAESDAEVITNVPYQEAIGSLIYAAICTRPDISYAVQALSQFNIRHTATHWTAVKRIFRYLKGTTNHGIIYSGSNDQINLRSFYENMRLEGYSDADWGANPDDRRSISGYAFLIGNGAVCWSSKKQTTVALSSMEAEYLAISHATKQALWLRTLLKELGYEQKGPTQINVDNQSAIAFTKDGTDHSRTKHIDIRHYFVRDHVENGNIHFEYIHTDLNSADIFTKALSKDKHGNLATSLGVLRA